MGAWHLVGNCLIADEGLCAHDALGERCRRNEKCARNLLGGEAADFAEGERNLSFGRQSGMAAGEDQAEAIIFDLLAVFMGPEGSFVDARFHVECKFSLGSVEGGPP